MNGRNPQALPHGIPMRDEKTDPTRKQFSLRDLMLVVLGTSVLVAGLGWIRRTAEQPAAFVLIYSIPIVCGMAGLLWRQFWGGVVGALAGGGLLWVVLRLIG